MQHQTGFVVQADLMAVSDWLTLPKVYSETSFVGFSVFAHTDKEFSRDFHLAHGL